MDEKWLHVDVDKDKKTKYGKRNTYVNHSDLDSPIACVKDRGVVEGLYSTLREIEIGYIMGATIELAGEQADGFMNWFLRYLEGLKS